MTVETKTEDLPPADSDKVTPSATEQPEKPKHEKIDRITALQDGIGKARIELSFCAFILIVEFLTCFKIHWFHQTGKAGKQY